MMVGWLKPLPPILKPGSGGGVRLEAREAFASAPVPIQNGDDAIGRGFLGAEASMSLFSGGIVRRTIGFARQRMLRAHLCSRLNSEAPVTARRRRCLCGRPSRARVATERAL